MVMVGSALLVAVGGIGAGFVRAMKRKSFKQITILYSI
jgi:hypothetical protein